VTPWWTADEMGELMNQNRKQIEDMVKWTSKSNLPALFDSAVEANGGGAAGVGPVINLLWRDKDELARLFCTVLKSKSSYVNELQSYVKEHFANFDFELQQLEQFLSFVNKNNYTELIDQLTNAIANSFISIGKGGKEAASNRINYLKRLWYYGINNDIIRGIIVSAIIKAFEEKHEGSSSINSLYGDEILFLIRNKLIKKKDEFIHVVEAADSILIHDKIDKFNRDVFYKARSFWPDEDEVRDFMSKKIRVIE
jgi:hypothetical protein